MHADPVQALTLAAGEFIRRFLLHVPPPASSVSAITQKGVIQGCTAVAAGDEQMPTHFTEVFTAFWSDLVDVARHGLAAGASSIKVNEWMQMPKYLIAIAASVCVVACAPTKALSPGDKGRIKEVGVTVATRFEQLTINCKGMGCAGILFGVGGDAGAAAALTNSYGKVGTGAVDLVAEEVMSQLKGHGVKVQAVEQTRFITLPKAPDLLSQTAKFQGNTLLHLQVWDFGLSRTGSTELQPTVLIRAYLVRREGSELLYSQAYNFGAEATGLPVNLGSTDTRFASVRDAQNDPETLARGLRAAVRAVVRRIVMDVSG